MGKVTLWCWVWSCSCFLVVRRTDATVFGVVRKCGPSDARCGFLNLGYVLYSGTQGDATCRQTCSLLPILEKKRYKCGFCLPPPTIAPSESPAPLAKTYELLLDLDVPVEDKVYFRRARDTWTAIIKGDLPDVRSAGLAPLDGGCAYPAVIDDLYVCCQYIAIDGPGNVVGRTSVLSTRSGNEGFGLPATARLRLDAADVASLKASGNFQQAVLHELGHALGFGTIWREKGVIKNEGTTCVYNGTRATAEYRAISGCGRVPTTCGHWNDTCLTRELMTTILSPNAALSRFTIGSMQDLGYVVDYSTADPFTVVDIPFACLVLCPSRSLLGVDSHEDAIQSTSGPERRQLSAAGYKNAVDYGRSVLGEEAASRRRLALSPGLTYVGDQMVYVLYMEENDLHSILVESL